MEVARERQQLAILFTDAKGWVEAVRITNCKMYYCQMVTKFSICGQLEASLGLMIEAI